MKLEEQSTEELSALLAAARDEYELMKLQGLRLDMSRGKPCPEQLKISMEMMDTLGSGSDLHSESGFDCRNYGELSGIPEMKRIFAEMTGVPESGIFVGGNSSLELMFGVISMAFTKGLPGSVKPWSKYETIKFLCPSPGYDRHFAVSDYFGFELVAVPMLETGPDMDVVEALVASDETIKGIWTVPVFSNPTGYIFSDETVERLAKMQCAADDFIVIWDQAYNHHLLYGEPVRQKNMLEACITAGNPNRVFVFTSTSKITFAGAGVACLGTSAENYKAFLGTAAIKTIGYDKVNQLRHARYLKNLDNIEQIMRRHAEILRPKFDVVLNTFEEKLSTFGFAEWTKPRGGYFISLNVLPGTAKRTYALCEEAGVVLTPAGAAYPYGNDAANSNLRIAPSFPTVEELQKASEVLCVAAVISAAEHLLHIKNK